MVGLPGNTEDPLEIISHEFKQRLRSLQNVFCSYGQMLRYRFEVRWSVEFFWGMVFPYGYEGGKE